MPFVVKVSFSYCDGSLFLFAELLFSVSPSFSFLNKQFVVVSVCVLFLSKTCGIVSFIVRYYRSALPCDKLFEYMAESVLGTDVVRVLFG
jgi:hypothetical protein